MNDLAAILLAGGRGSRMGGISKPLLEIHGRTLLDAAIEAAQRAGCEPIVLAAERITGPGAPTAQVTWVREDPPYGGPAAAILAALPHVTASRTLILACDLPRADDAVTLLLASVTDGDGVSENEGVCLSDAEGRAQWLTGIYRTGALRDAAAAIPHGGHDLSVRALLGDLRIDTVAAADDIAKDIDTWDDLNEARRRNPMSEHLPPEALDEWADALREQFGLGEDDIPIPLILDLARDVATGVARPAAPLSAFIAGLVAGRAGGTPEQTRAAVAEITSRAKAWRSED